MRKGEDKKGDNKNQDQQVLFTEILTNLPYRRALQNRVAYFLKEDQETEINI
jgi:hypothetical protein